MQIYWVMLAQSAAPETQADSGWGPPEQIIVLINPPTGIFGKHVA
jgi:hypothetical protein